MKRRSPSLNKSLLQRGDFDGIVRHYISEYRESSARELSFFANQRTFAEAIMKAALAQRPDGKRFSHQRRIPGAALEASHRRLMNVISTLESAASFGELFQIVEDAIGDIPQIGELTIYDTALRIAAWRHLEPEEVYLHAGTRCGAQALGLNVRRTFAALTEFPPELLRLRAQEIEDVLCIYKDVLAGTRAIPRKRC